MSAPAFNPPLGDGVLLLLGWLMAKIHQDPSVMGYRHEATDLEAAAIIVSDTMLGKTYRISITDVVTP